METLDMILLAVLALFIIGPGIKALFSNRSPIPELSQKVYKIKVAGELDALLSSCTYVVVDFYADWCPPCRTIAPVFSKLADTYSRRGHIAFAKVNVDHVKNVAKRYSVSSMPTFMIFEKGVPRGVEVEGLQDRESVNRSDDGRVYKVCGADRQALEAVAQALGAKEQNTSKTLPAREQKDLGCHSRHSLVDNGKYWIASADSGHIGLRHVQMPGLNLMLPSLDRRVTARSQIGEHYDAARIQSRSHCCRGQKTEADIFHDS
ncbi:hypothetical protein E4U21_003381 [Claviceps maximensis]|nr:hypothetical protein E4U21_003381 [Claviceps maximensis]